MNSLLAITYAFMISCCPYHNIGYGEEVEEHTQPTHVVYQLGVDVCDCLEFYTGEETYQVQEGSLFTWLPYSQSYWLGVEYHKEFGDELELSAGIKHKCQHPTYCCGRQESKFDYACTELYVGVKGKFDIF
jgi:hypothetical protein